MSPTILARDIRRQMDHSILTIAVDPTLPAGRPDAYLSLYWVGMTLEAGPPPLAGHLAYLWVAGQDGAEPTVAVLTDSLALATALASRTSMVRWELPGTWPEPRLARFRREAATPLAHAWDIATDDGMAVEASWSDLGEPVFATGETRGGGAEITTLLVSARRVSLRVDGRDVPGAPFPDPIWTPWFGAEQTSCVIGLGETIHVPLGQ